MNYLKNYIEAFRYSEKFSDEIRNANDDYAEVEKILSSNWENRHQEYYVKTLEVYQKLGEAFLLKRPQDQIAGRCHGIATDFWCTFKDSEFFKFLSLDVTVGNVFYKGENLYNLSRGKLKKIIKRGPQPNEMLDVHVWLTGENMSVFDPTIISNLHCRGLLKEPKLNGSSILLWNEEEKGDFEFEPILVDNKFLWRVDNIIGEYRPDGFCDTQ